MIELEDYFGEHPGDIPSAEVKANAVELLAKVNSLLAELALELQEAREPKVNSGWRPAWYNATVSNASPTSKHITGQAIDLADPEGSLDAVLMARQEALVAHGLYLEHPASTRRWCHLQTVAPKSGNRVFYP